MSDFTADTAMWGHTSPDTAFLVDDYPYGRVRTQIRYWVETHPKRGDRFVSQTLNPATLRWNAPKPSTYSPVIVMYAKPENGHITWASVSTWAEDEWLRHFLDVAGDHLSEAQKRQVAQIVGLHKAFKGVTFHARTTAPTDEERAADARAERQLSARVAHEVGAATEAILAH